jgi:hypothetical protein
LDPDTPFESLSFREVFEPLPSVAQDAEERAQYDLKEALEVIARYAPASDQVPYSLTAALM